ncbi:uncharacterized protein [Diadema antillarum]|uniref:uncharacterized protein n=1 Tax=Diadema antillarum TaxID=105358 RepID=UPI003A842C6C
MYRHVTGLFYYVVIFCACVARQSGVYAQCSANGEVVVSGQRTTRLCAGERWLISCTSQGETAQVFKDGVMIFNGSAPSDGISSTVTFPYSEISPSCFIVFINIPSAGLTDAGNYSCRTNTSLSDERSLIVDPRIDSVNCTIEVPMGYVVQEGQNASLVCMSDRGKPTWQDVEPPTISYTTDVGPFASRLDLLSVTSSLISSLICRVSTPTISACPSVSNSCSARLVVVDEPLESYLSLTPSVNVITQGQTATYKCSDTLPGAMIVLTSLIPSLEFISFTLGGVSEISFLNLTQNYSEPIVECTLTYLQGPVVSATGSVLVLPAEDVVTSSPPSQTTITGTPPGEASNTTVEMFETSFRSISTTTNIESKPTLPIFDTGQATKEMTSTPPYFDPNSGRPMNFTTVIVGLVIGLLLFISIAVVIVLVLRYRVRKRGTWTMSMPPGRRGRGVVATSDHLEGRLEWETDTNPLFFQESSLSCRLGSDDDASLSNGDHDNPVSPNPTHKVEPAARNIVAVVDLHESYDRLEEEASPTRKTQPEEQRGWQSGEDERSNISDSGDTTLEYGVTNIGSDASETAETSVNAISPSKHRPNGHISNRESRHDSEEEEEEEEEEEATKNDVNLRVLHFVDATKPDLAHDSPRDGDSGVSLGPDESVLSEIEEGAINIVTV